MRQSRATIVIGLLAAVLTACLGAQAATSPDPSQSDAPPTQAPSASATPDIREGASAEPTSSASAAPADGQPGAEPPDDGLPPFTCDLPIHGDATVAIANIVDVRTGTHAGYDRLVFQFAGGVPEITLGRAMPPFTQDASGDPISVDGSSFLQLTMRGGTKQTDEGTSSYDGPRSFDTGFPMLVHAIEGGDFERQSTWYLGLAAEACVRVLALTDEPRLVIDVEH